SLRRKSIEIPYPVRVIRDGHVPIASAGAEHFEHEILNQLRQVDFLHDLSDDELQLLLPGVTVLKFGTGETVVRQGDEGDSLYIIRSGTVEVVATNGTREVHLRDL